MPKVLHIIPSLKFGGEERFLLDLYPFLSKKFEHIICPFLHAGELYTQDINLENYENNRFWLFVFQSKTILASILKPFLTCYYSYRACGIIRNQKPEVVISYTVQAAIAVYVASFFAPKRCFFWYARVGSDIDHSALLPKIFRYRYIYPTVKLFINTVFKKVFSKPNLIFTVNSFLIRKMAITYKIEKEKFFFLPCCSPKKNADHDNKDVITNDNFLISIGRLEYEKGFDFLINSFSCFSKAYPKIKLIIAGEGSERKKLEKLIRLHKLDKKIFLPGFIKNPEQLISRALICLVPSRSEGFCKVVIEAMAQRSIVIASNCDFGPREIITDSIDGVLFKSENTNALLEAMNHVMQMPEEKKTILKNNAYQKSLKYDPECIAELHNNKLEMDYIS